MPRRTPLCETCGDNTLNSRVSKILIFVVFAVFLIATGILYIFNAQNTDQFLIIFTVVIIGSITFGLIAFVIIQKQENK